MDWTTVVIPLVTFVVGGGLAGVVVQVWQTRRKNRRDTEQDYIASLEKQIASAEKRNDAQETERLRREYEQQLEALRAQKNLGLIAPKEISREPSTLPEEEITRLRTLLTNSAIVHPASLSAYDHFLRGNSYFEIEEYDQAILEYTSAIALGPDYAETYNNRGLAYSRNEAYDRAIEDFNEAIRLRPGSIAYNNRGNAYGHKGKRDRAIEDYNEAIRLRPDYAEAYFNRGITYGHKEEYDKALENFNEAIRLRPDYADAYINRSHVHNHIGRFELSLQDANKALDLDHEETNAYVNRGIAYTFLDRDEEAQQDFDRAVELGYDRAEIERELEELKQLHKSEQE